MQRQPEPADVLIVGAGASGGVAALELVRAGVSVVCLERGGWPSADDYPGRGADAELQAARRWAGDPNVRAGPGDYPIDVSDSDYGVSNFNGVGGGTILYNGQWPRMLPDDFRVRSMDGVADDWPISYADLQPYYEKTDRQFGVSGMAGNPKYPAGGELPLPPMPIGEMGMRVARAHAQLGWHWWPATNAIASVAYEGRRPCVQRGTCGTGCNEGAKGSADVTHWRLAAQLGARVVTGAAAVRVTTDRRGLANGAEYVGGDGVLRHQPANVVVLAANAIGTTRLLLASELANSSGLVGRRLMLHPLVSVGGVFDGAGSAWRAHNGALIHSLEFASSDASRGFVRGATWALGSASGPLRHALAGGGRWGAEHHEHVRRRFGHTASWVAICEDLPDESNRVELSGTDVDDVGLPVPQLHYRRDANTTRLMEWQVEHARRSLETAGASEIEVTWHGANGHLLGTARMGLDPATSVVDEWCVSHDVRNLLIVDGSVFVTAGSANPTSTIAAIALRATARLLDHRREIPQPEHTHVLGPFEARPRPATVEVAPTPPSDAERAAFAVYANAQIPADDAMPGASAVGVHEGLLDAVLTARPELLGPWRSALAELGSGALSERGQHRLRQVAASAYYLSGDVRDALGIPSDGGDPVRPDLYPAYVVDGLLDHVVSDN